MTKYTVCILSSMVLFILGTTTAQDVDPMIYNKMDDKRVDKMVSKMCDQKMDIIKLNKDNIWYWQKTQDVAYWMSYAISLEWPQSVGASNITEVFFNPKYHFYMYGIKFVSYDLQMQRLMKRNSPAAYVDLYAVKKFNDPDLQIKCISKVRSRQGKIEYVDDTIYKAMLVQIKKYFGNEINGSAFIRDLYFELFTFEHSSCYSACRRH